MPFIVDNSTYERTIYDPDDIEPVFKVDGKIVEVEKLSELIEAGGKLEVSQLIKEDAKPVDVTFKPLRAGDKTAIEDTIQMEYGSASAQMAPGSMRRLAIKRAVVRWTHKTPFSENVLDNLDPAVFEQLYGWVSWGSAPPEQDPVTGLPLDEEAATQSPEPKPASKTKKQEPVASGSTVTTT